MYPIQRKRVVWAEASIVNPGLSQKELITNIHSPLQSVCGEKTISTLASCDEAHFWLNGYVNKQNCRIWSEANPKVYVETPLHPEKLTVWCTLWAGGILLQKR
ncbi:uncharacterized protein TNCV_2028661 [Trichonephila clavipes]|nr:uncharacterized protein TNCV_2028661 [Trichonephila clavipes]